MVDNILKYNLNISSILLRKHLKKLLLCLIYINFALWYPGRMAYAGVLSKISWQNLETRYSIIQYETVKDLERFNAKIDYSPDEWGFKNLFSNFKSKDPIASIKKKVDAVFEKAQKILGMHGKIKNVVIRIYPNKNRFHEVQNKVAGEKSRIRTRIRAWYIYEQNTIYINNDDVHEGILAHEIAHAIIDHYLTVRPPRATAEILARYVDKHLYH